jgi:hypothetical protein
MWKQRGRIIHTNGYVRVFMPNHYSAVNDRTPKGGGF